MEAAWAYRHRPAVGAALRKRQEGLREEVKEIAWKAQHPLHKRYRSLAVRGKSPLKIVTAVGRELLGFIWAIGNKVDSNGHRTQIALALLVRGSFRRITIMRFRPANIRVINRRRSSSIGHSLCPLRALPVGDCERHSITGDFSFLRQFLRTVLALRGSLRRAATAHP
jgi:hypothetical protein